MKQIKRTRMYEPWGYREENNYQGSETIRENDLSKFFADVEYKRSDNKIHFTNKDGEEVGTLNVDDFIKSDQIVEKAWYEDGKIYIKFTNGDLITIDVKELLDENEFKDGLQVVDGVVSVLKDPTTERWLTVSMGGVKVSGIQAEIDRLDERIDNEIDRATSEEQRIEARLDQEIQDRIEDVDAEEERAIGEEERIEGRLDNEITRATRTEQALNTRVDSLNDELDREGRRAQAAEQEIKVLLLQEISDRRADVDEEENRAKAAERVLHNAIDNEVARATSAETDLQDAIFNEATRAQTVEGQLWGGINGETTRAQEVEEQLWSAINNEVTERTSNSVASAEYDSSATTINFLNANNEVISSIDASDFIKGGMIEDVRVENGKLVIVFNTGSGMQTIEIPLTDIFDPSNYYTKDDIDDKVSVINENINSEVVARESGDTALDGEITALAGVVATKANTTDVEDALALKADKTEIPTDFYTKDEVDGKDVALQSAIDGEVARATSAETDLQDAIDDEAARAISAETDLEIALSGKADADTVYTQAEVDALLAAKESEIYSLKKIVGEIGGNVTYEFPTEGTLTSLMNNNGTVKLTEDATISRFGPGITAKNKVKVNLNSHNITATGATGAYPAIMSRGTQEITIGGKGTVDAGSGICIEANGADSVINLTGSTSVYQTDRSGGELIYCYAGTINITNGTFKNLGESKAYMLNCYDSNYAAGTAKIIVTGGKFYDFNPADNTSEGEHTSFVPEGYHVETSTDGDSTVYTVKKDA